MGWKSTKTLSREKAIRLIEERIYDASNDQLGDALESLGYGDETDLPCFGCNFWVTDNDDESDDLIII